MTIGLTKLEKVARAISACTDPLSAARAALEALRQPNLAQYEALSATGKMWRDLDSITVWQTYIDAILNEKPKPTSI